MTISYDIKTLLPYINWVYYHFAWQVRQPEEQDRLRQEATRFLLTEASLFRARGVFRLFDCHASGDDIVIDGESGRPLPAPVRLPMLRQQTGDSPLCLADFINPHGDRIGIFATSTDEEMVSTFRGDDYKAMMAQFLADRLAEAAAEKLHEEVRKHYWGYAPSESLTIAQLHLEQFQGIRPAVGYPALPDASLNFLIDQLVDLSTVGIRLTENGAMRPHASVSGMMISHPSARYFATGQIGSDQLADYARRRGLPLETIKKFVQ